MERAWRDFPCGFWGKLHTTMELLYGESLERFSLWVLREVTYHNGIPLWREPGEIFPVGSEGGYIPQWNSSMERAWRDFPGRF